jgi:hypothetical protein
MIPLAGADAITVGRNRVVCRSNVLRQYNAYLLNTELADHKGEPLFGPRSKLNAAALAIPLRRLHALSRLSGRKR